MSTGTGVLSSVTFQVRERRVVPRARPRLDLKPCRQAATSTVSALPAIVGGPAVTVCSAEDLSNLVKAIYQGTVDAFEKVCVASHESSPGLLLGDLFRDDPSQPSDEDVFAAMEEGERAAAERIEACVIEQREARLLVRE